MTTYLTFYNWYTITGRAIQSPTSVTTKVINKLWEHWDEKLTKDQIKNWFKS